MPYISSLRQFGIVFSSYSITRNGGNRERYKRTCTKRLNVMYVYRCVRTPGYVTASANHVALSRSTARPPPQVNVSSTAAINEVISGQGNVTQSIRLPFENFTTWLTSRQADSQTAFWSADFISSASLAKTEICRK